MLREFGDALAGQIEVGKKAPDFELKDNLGNDWRLSEQSGNVTALLFYPKNETLVCTKQLCSVRDHWEDYLKTKANIVGISSGTISEHKDFSRKYRLPLPLLADETKQITRIFCRHWWMPVKFVRAIIVIDAKGYIRSKKLMFRGFRPTDYSVIQDIYSARTDALQERFNKIINQHQDRQAKISDSLSETEFKINRREIL